MCIGLDCLNTNHCNIRRMPQSNNVTFKQVNIHLAVFISHPCTTKHNTTQHNTGAVQLCHALSSHRPRASTGYQTTRNPCNDYVWGMGCARCTLGWFLILKVEVIRSPDTLFTPPPPIFLILTLWGLLPWSRSTATEALQGTQPHHLCHVQTHPLPKPLRIHSLQWSLKNM
jgi:hypothetical protein